MRALGQAGGTVRAIIQGTTYRTVHQSSPGPRTGLTGGLTFVLGCAHVYSGIRCVRRFYVRMPGLVD
jgi:hypothetical protein